MILSALRLKDKPDLLRLKHFSRAGDDWSVDLEAHQQTFLSWGGFFMGMVETLAQSHSGGQDKAVRSWGATESLRQGSDGWIRLRFDAIAEAVQIEQVRERLSLEGRDGEFHQLVEKWLELQFGFFLTEFGAGRTLPIQPPYLAEVEMGDDGQPRVYAFSLKEFGDQRRSQVSFEKINEAVRDGLQTVYQVLSGMSEGEGLFRVSPSEFYQAFGSTYDVVEFYRVAGVREDGSRLMEGRYLILDRRLTPDERVWVANHASGFDDEKSFLGTDGRTILPYSPNLLVRNPQKIQYKSELDDPVLLYMWELNDQFERRFGRPLVGETDFVMYEKIFARVRDTMPRLMQLCQRAMVDDSEIIPILRSMMFSSQRQWAQLRGIDPDEHMRMILSGELIVGFEAAGNDPFDLVFDSFFKLTSEQDYCGMHAKYYRGECPDCRSLRHRLN